MADQEGQDEPLIEDALAERERVPGECSHCGERRLCYVVEGRAGQMLCVRCIGDLARRGVRWLAEGSK